MLTKLRAATEDESGFTLVELLVVIAILGVLASVVVFSVAGITDNSQTSACKTEVSTVRAAQEAYYVKNKSYTNDAGLVGAKLLATNPSMVDTAAGGGSYTVTWADAACGTVGDPAS